jgi:hypothetical protein
MAALLPWPMPKDRGPKVLAKPTIFARKKFKTVAASLPMTRLGAILDDSPLREPGAALAVRMTLHDVSAVVAATPRPSPRPLPASAPIQGSPPPSRPPAAAQAIPRRPPPASRRTSATSPLLVPFIPLANFYRQHPTDFGCRFPGV